VLARQALYPLEPHLHPSSTLLKFSIGARKVTLKFLRSAYRLIKDVCTSQNSQKISWNFKSFSKPFPVTDLRCGWALTFSLVNSMVESVAMARKT
jgi:hypothetical protein